MENKTTGNVNMDVLCTRAAWFWDFIYSFNFFKKCDCDLKSSSRLAGSFL